ncbi:UNVERIFIED_CONTAM: hypothetical protein HDU68_000884 [Siphonaria sp. JEL0065]|nr:hypothetical protein HDU68_000884 [Siphonaria sp. JEL0065]
MTNSLRRLKRVSRQTQPLKHSTTIESLSQELLDIIVPYLDGLAVWRLAHALPQLKHISAVIYNMHMVCQVASGGQIMTVPKITQYWPILSDSLKKLPITPPFLDYLLLLKRYHGQIGVGCLNVGIGVHKHLLPDVSLYKFVDNADYFPCSKCYVYKPMMNNECAYDLNLDETEGLACPSIWITTVLGELDIRAKTFSFSVDENWKSGEMRAFVNAVAVLRPIALYFSDGRDNGDHILTRLLETIESIETLSVLFTGFSYLADCLEDLISLLPSCVALKKVEMRGQGRGVTMEGMNGVEGNLKDCGWTLEFFSMEQREDGQDEWNIKLNHEK